jgi:CHAT domain-containing protein
MTTDHEEAVRALVTRPDCTDTVVAKLELLAGRNGQDGALLSDLSAAYHIRAQRRDRPSDLLRALDMAERAVAAAPALREAIFNRALAQESLGLDADARASWEEFGRIDETPWGTEAGERRRRLERAASVAAATQWSMHQQRLADGVTTKDADAVAQMITPYPAAAQRFVEEDVLPLWAEAVKKGRADEARRQLEVATVIATQLAQVTPDRYLLDVVNRIHASRGASLRSLQEGHLALRAARRNERVKAKDAAAQFERARDRFAAAASPAAARAEIGRTIPLWLLTFDAPGLREMLATPEQVARAHDYGSLITRIEANRANFLVYESRHIDALRHYDASIASAARMNDRENVANMHARKVGVLRTLGHKDDASREALLALRSAPGVVDVPSRHFVLGENAAAALAQGYPAIAMVYQNEAVREIVTALSLTTDDAEIAYLRTNLGIALRHRAAIHLRLEHYPEAESDLAEAMRLTANAVSRDKTVRNALQARIHEVSGQKSMKELEPAKAAESFTEALRLLFPGEYRTFRATLFMQRAEAYAATGQAKRTERDLLDAINELRAEQQHLLETRTRGEAEPYWTPYFWRFRDVYENLIRLYVDQGDVKKAFAFAEEVRAFEPLNLVLQLEVVSDTFRRWTRDGQTLALETIQSSLPENTYLIEFTALPDQIYVWIVGRNYFDLVKQPVHRDVIEQWSASLQRMASEGNTNGSFMATLEQAHRSLLAEPLKKIDRLARPNDPPNLVFVPDRAIHGLPLAALRDRKSGRYVIEDHPISIAASATFYLFSRERDEALAALVDKPSVLLVGDPAFNPKLEPARRLGRLSWALDEIDRIALLYGAAAIKLPEARATVPEFIRLAQQSMILHFAGHAVANPDAPFRSLLLLAPSPDHNGVLVAEELLTRFTSDKTRMVVLSACSSAGGVPIGPEGLAPLVRPLLAAGVPAVVGSLWDVRDHGSAELLVAFHRHFREGQDANHALRLAQLELLRKKGASSSVLVWGPFQVIGHASSPYR